MALELELGLTLELRTLELGLVLELGLTLELRALELGLTLELGLALELGLVLELRTLELGLTLELRALDLAVAFCLEDIFVFDVCVLVVEDFVRSMAGYLSCLRRA
jgi:hypothetical protein